MMENKTSDINQESRNMHIRNKGTNQEERIQASGIRNPGEEPLGNSAQPRKQSNQQTQLKASRDVRFSHVKLCFLPR